jgi:hypothetical protein
MVKMKQKIHIMIGADGLRILVESQKKRDH